MVSNEAIEFANLLATLSARTSDPNLDLSTIRDIIETIHRAATEPDGVTYVEQNVGGVEALWCVPAGSDDSAVPLHNHLGGTVVASMYSDRKGRRAYCQGGRGPGVGAQLSSLAGAQIPGANRRRRQRIQVAD